MRKLAFLQKEPLSRLGVAFLLTAGVSLPLLLALDLGPHAPLALLLGVGLLLALTALTATRTSRRLLWIVLGGFTLLQAFFPGFGLFGRGLEGLKALSLYFGGYTAALPLFGAEVAGLLTVLAAVLAFVFSKRGVGFLPAAVIVVLVLFALWNLGKAAYLWYTAPALVALLLQMSQAAHEKINMLHVLPMALAAVLLAFALLPAGRLTLEPLASAARSLKQAISDYLFFTEPRNVFTLGTYGYYPMGGSQLGGEAEPSEYPVMTVRADQKTLLRAVVKDFYSGRNFTDTSSAKRYLYINPRWQGQRRKVFLEALPSEAIRNASHLLDEKAVSIQMQNRAASTVFTPLFLRSLTMTGDMVPYFNDASELFITRDLQQGDRYTVFTPILEGGQAGLDALVNASRKGEDDYAGILSAFSQLPGHLEPKVYDDVANIVRSETTPYGKALAIMRHLQKYYRYTLKPETPPQNQDFVTYFLYKGKEGYCTYFAAAMTVMCRMVGLPARYVEGFLAMPSADGFAYVTGKDAHAWTEVYFEGFGWVPFDPTPQQQQNGADTPPQSEPSPSPSPSQEPTPTPTANADTPPDQPTQEPEPSPEPQDQPEDTPPEIPPDEPTPFPWALLIAAAELAALCTRIALRMPVRVASRKPTEKEKIFVYGAAVQRLLQYARRGPKDGETPLAFARRVDGVRVFPTPIAPLWRMLALSNYSRMEPTAEHTARARETWKLAMHGSHPLRRLRFMLAAAFDPRFYRVLDTPAPHDPPVKPPTFKAPKPAGSVKNIGTAYRRAQLGNGNGAHTGNGNGAQPGNGNGAPVGNGNGAQPAKGNGAKPGVHTGAPSGGENSVPKAVHPGAPARDGQPGPGVAQPAGDPARGARPAAPQDARREVGSSARHAGRRGAEGANARAAGHADVHGIKPTGIHSPKPSSTHPEKPGARGERPALHTTGPHGDRLGHAAPPPQARGDKPTQDKTGQRPGDTRKGTPGSGGKPGGEPNRK